MIPFAFGNRSSITSFRTKLLVAMMFVIAALTALAVYLVQRSAAGDAERALHQQFRNELASLDRAEELRHQALADRCRTLVRNPRLHAALEDNALDLLYPSAKDELRDIMQRSDATTEEQSLGLRASFYRFLNFDGSIISPPNPAEIGVLSDGEQAQLVMKALPQTQQIGYFFRASSTGQIVEEVTALPIFSTETGDVISALVVGFNPLELEAKSAGAGMRSGIWVNGHLHLPSLSTFAAASLSDEITRELTSNGPNRNSFPTSLEGRPHLLFFRILNPASVFPPAYQVCIYPLQNAIVRQRQLQSRIIGGGILLLALGFFASHFASARLSQPVEKLAIESETNLAERRRAEATLASTSKELQRSARFSADASHQLKSPVTVLRAGIESLLGRNDFDPSVYDELSSLLHQTYRLTGIIDDLLLLSRMDAGRLQIEFGPVELSQLVNEWLEDLTALPDAVEVTVEKQIAPDLQIAGERRYTSLVVQNLLENARKYNRPGGRIRVTAQQDGTEVILNVGNTGETIASPTQEHIFERFHRGSIGERVAGHGLGLNLARELARLHGGELRLVRSANDWTEFEVKFRLLGRAHNGARRA